MTANLTYLMLYFYVVSVAAVPPPPTTAPPLSARTPPPPPLKKKEQNTEAATAFTPKQRRLVETNLALLLKRAQPRIDVLRRELAGQRYFLFSLTRD